MVGIAMHGFGRIGRSLTRVALKDDVFVPVSISDIKDVSTLAALFEIDSHYGRWSEEVTAKDGGFVVGGREIPYVDSMKALPNWKALGVDLVIVDLPLTAIQGDLLSVAAWYDNETGYSYRLAEAAARMAA